MKQWKRLFYYLLMNVLVSACTTYAVLTVWDRTHTPLLDGPSAFTPTAPAAQASQPSALTGGTAIPAGTATPVYIVYQVKEGDTFESIAEQFGVDKDVLIAANGFQKDQILGAGEALQIPVSSSNQGQGSGVVIFSVAGPGDLDSERVDIVLNGQEGVSLENWKLEDERGNIYTFPSLELLTDGAMVSVYSKAGTDSAGKLYWGLSAPLWRPGETVTLRDAEDNVKSTYVVP